MDNNGTVPPTPPGSQPPQGQEIILNLNHGTMPVAPPPGINPAMPPANPMAPMQPDPTTIPYPPQPQPQPMGMAPQQPYPPTMPAQPGYPGMPQQPNAPWQAGPVPQGPYPAGMVPPTTPANMIGQPPSGEDDDAGRKKLLFIIGGAVIAVLLIGGIAFALIALNSKKPSKPLTNNTASISCTDPTTGATVSKQNAEEVFVRVATAIKQKDQACVTSLSSAYFTQVQNEVYPNANGQWITKSENGLPSLAARLAKVPSKFTVSQFSSSDYTRAATTGASSTSSSSTATTNSAASTATPPAGVTLSYPVTDASTGAASFLEISFVANNGKVAVDYLKLVPNTANGSSAASPASQNADAVAANQELAQEDVISIDAYLTAYRGSLNSFPSTLDAPTFINAGIGVDTNAFTPPAGTSFVYTPGPGGCTTAAKNCTTFTLSAIATSDNSTIYSMNGSTTN